MPAMSRTAAYEVGTPLALRVVAAAAAAGAAFAHIPPMGTHFEEVPYIGVAFALLTTVCLAGIIGVLADERPIWWLGMGAGCGIAIVAYVVSRTVGLPGMADDIGHWTEPLGVVSVVTESITVAISAAALLTMRQRRPAR